MPGRSSTRTTPSSAVSATTASSPTTTSPSGTSPSGTSPSGQESKASPQVGELAPDFSLAGDDGHQHSLVALRGKRVLLYFYPRDSTPGCTVEACDFRDRHASFAKAGVTILGVSGDDLKSHARFRGKQSLNFPLLSDLGNAVARSYGAFGDKMMYGRKLEGIIRSTFLIGIDGRIEALWRPVRVPGHAEAALVAATAR
jgi:peroxiredoxin Q/BCP